MFGKLKEKLKAWVKKVSEKETEEIVKESPKKKIIIPPTKYNAGAHTFEPDLEKLKEEISEAEPQDNLTGQGGRAISREKTVSPVTSEVASRVGTPKVEEKIPEPTEKGFFKKIVSKIKKIKITEETFDVYADELEMLLLENNVALEVAEKMIKELREKIVGQELLKKEVEEEIKDIFKEIIDKILVKPFKLSEKIKIKQMEKPGEPYVVLFCGINGSGKTTSIAKIAELLKQQGISSVLAASDTFRAASIEQLKKHGEKIDVKVISHNYGTDPAAVGFDAIKYAKKNRIDCVLIDTAGRIHTAKNLLKEIELKKSQKSATLT